MAYALVGTLAPTVVTSPSPARAASPTWGVGQNRTAGNLLLCWVSGAVELTTLTYVAPATPSGWTKAIQSDNGGNQPVAAIFFKIATGADAAPTFAAASPAGSPQQWVVQLAEFTGNTASPLDQVAASAALGTTPTSWVVTCPSAESTDASLIVTLSVVETNGGVGGPPTLSDSVNNQGTQFSINDNALAVGSNNLRYQLTYGPARSRAAATSDAVTYSTNGTNAASSGGITLVVTFKAASGPVALTPTAVATARAATIVTTGGPLAFIADAQAAAATVNLPSGWQPGDLAVAYAYRNGSTAPPTVPAGWTSITATTGANTNSRAIGWRVLQAGDTSTGTWTNATDIAVAIMRGQATVPIGAFASGGTNTTTLTMPALTLTKTDGSSWLLLFAGSKATNANTVTYPNSIDEGSSDSALNCAFQPVATAFAGGSFSTAVDTSANRTDVIEILSGPKVTAPTGLPSPLLAHRFPVRVPVTHSSRGQF